MGTNYYVEMNCCSLCGRNDRVHVGKASAGWRFALHITPELPNLAAWEPVLRKELIKDEYGRKIEAQDFLDMIRSRADERRHPNDQHFPEYDAVAGDFS